jgi:hypothetical protein
MYDPNHFVLTLWTNEPALARRADAAGVDRIGLDLETYKKAERQPKALSTWISPHAEEQLPALRESIGRGKLFCRVNPVADPGCRAQIDRLAAYGVEVMMLPMFTSADEVRRFVDYVNGRAECVLLLENCEAADRVEEIVKVPGVSDVHVGINDLTLSLCKRTGDTNRNRFGVLASDLMHRVGRAVLGEGIRFGVGGIGRVMDNDQKIPSDLVYAQYPRLGATAALIARSFFGPDPQTLDLTAEVKRARDRLSWWAGRPAAEWDAARRELAAKAGGASW